ncbi:hypothetical protein HPB48_001379 [Haemaphysalis longicornis]|uniref:Nose resistant-to-fluoxetine protein N-terminal domain-containing protein n=1 Tax=Haemaphysalis longicornis TaxID=44386 RepID=A0A9J6FFN8_HAELO|nr:hypothetical protein HPB48_001379 [Haemaphysalis longicornis]
MHIPPVTELAGMKALFLCSRCGPRLLRSNYLKLRVIDSTGRPAAGTLEGTLSDFGNYDECLKIRLLDDYTGEETFRGKYCTLKFAAPMPPKPERLNYHQDIFNTTLEEGGDPKNLRPSEYAASTHIYFGLLGCCSLHADCAFRTSIREPEFRRTADNKMQKNAVQRIVPPLGFTVAIIILLPVFGRGPVWHEIVDVQANKCEQNWWQTLLFFANFVTTYDSIALAILGWAAAITLQLAMIYGIRDWHEHYETANNVVSDLVFSYAAAFIGTMLFEVPMLNLEKIILRPFSGASKKQGRSGNGLSNSAYSPESAPVDFVINGHHYPDDYKRSTGGERNSSSRL